MTQRLAHKVVVVIGGTRGIGLSAAKALVKEGAKVVVLGREEADVEAARQVLGRAALGLAADAADPGAAAAAIQIAVRNFDGFHGLYHVAGGSGRKRGDGPLHELTDEGWEYTMRQNLDSVFYSNRAAVRQFLAQRSGGSVLNLSSVLAWSPAARFATHAYAAAKQAIIGLTRAAASQYAPQNIRFNALAPGLVATPMSARAQSDPSIMAYIQTKQPLDGGRIGQPEDLDGAAVWLLSEESRFVTGQVLAIDGGWTVTEGNAVVRVESPPTAKPVSGWSLLGRAWGKVQGKRKEDS